MIPGLLDGMIKAEDLKIRNWRPQRRIEPTFIPIKLSGGIGDVIMAVDAMVELSKKYKIAVYTPHIETFKYFCKEPINVFKEMPYFTWRIEFNTLARFIFEDGFTGFLIPEHGEFYRKHLAILQSDHRLEAFHKNFEESYNAMARYAREMDLDRRTLPMKTIGVSAPPPKVWYNNPKDIITIHDGFDTSNTWIVDGRATKTWKWNYWNDLVREIHLKHPEYKIIQLGASPTARAIDGVDECLIDKTSITEAFDLISTSMLHIDGDSGLMHAAHRMCVECVALWGPTPDWFFGYADEINLRNRTTCQGSCYWLKRDWMNKCPVGWPTPKCMDDISVDQVMEAIDGIL